MSERKTAQQLVSLVRHRLPHLANGLSYSTYTSICQSCRQTVLIHEVKSSVSARARTAECPYCSQPAMKAVCTALVARPTP